MFKLKYVLDRETAQLYYIWRSTLMLDSGYSRDGCDWYDVCLEPVGLTAKPLPGDVALTVGNSGALRVRITRSLGCRGKYLPGPAKGLDRYDQVEALVRGSVVVVPDDAYPDHADDREDAVFMGLWEYVECINSYCDEATAEAEETRAVGLMRKINDIGLDECLPEVEAFFKRIAEDGWMDT